MKILKLVAPLVAAVLAVALAAPASASTASYLTTKEAKHVAGLRIKQTTNRYGFSYVRHDISFCTRYSATLVGCDYYSEAYNQGLDDTMWTEGQLLVREMRGGYSTRARGTTGGWLSGEN